MEVEVMEEEEEVVVAAYFTAQRRLMLPLHMPIRTFACLPVRAMFSTVPFMPWSDRMLGQKMSHKRPL